MDTQIHKQRQALLENSRRFVFCRRAAPQRISPSINNQLPVHAPLMAMFRLYNIATSSRNWGFVAKARLLSEKGEEILCPPLTLDEGSSKTGDSEAAIVVHFSFPNVTPGKYTDC
jgi:hypothetical protein